MNIKKLTIDQTKRLNEISNELRHDYNLFVDEISKHHSGDEYWWMTKFANRNTSWDDTFKRICTYFLCKEEMIKEECNEIIVDTIGMKKSLAQLDKKNVKIIYRFSIKNETTARLNNIRQVVNDVIDVMASRYYVNKGNKVKNNKKVSLLVVTPVVSSCFDENVFKDGYFNSIEKYVKTDFYCIPYLVKTDGKSWKDFIEKTKRINTREQIFSDSYGKWYDFIYYIVFLRKCRKYSKSTYTFDGDDISAIIKESLLRQHDMIRTVCDYKAFDRMLDCVDARNLVLWYEARPIDNLMAYSYHRHKKEGRSIGYIGYPISEQMLGVRVTQEQQRQHACPSIITVTGEKYKKEICEFNKKINVKVVPSMRDQYCRIEHNKRIAHRFTVLVTLPYFERESRAILELINEYCNIVKDIEIHVKMHPANKSLKVENYIDSKLNFTPKYVSGALKECAKEADVVVSTKSSSIMEIIFGGIPLICVCVPGELAETYIPSDINKNTYSIVYDTSDMVSAIDKVMLKKEDNNSDINIESYSCTIKKDSFKIFFDNI